MSTMHIVAAVVTAIYGMVALIGGIIGYVKANSLASLLAGGIAGVLLILCAAGISRFPVTSLCMAIILALLLATRFVVSARNAGELSTVAFVMIAGGVIVVACAALAFMAKS
jgi:uncharacterized membrane protein (UPF0136 family)